MSFSWKENLPQELSDKVTKVEKMIQPRIDEIDEQKEVTSELDIIEKACKSALLDIYWDLAACKKLMKSHPDWNWLKDKKAELEAKEKELEKELA